MRYASFLLLALMPAVAPARVWTNVEGKKLTAEFVSATKTTVKLKATDGTEHDYPLKKLSAACQGAVTIEKLRRLQADYQAAYQTRNAHVLKKACQAIERQLKPISGSRLVINLGVREVTEDNVSFYTSWYAPNTKVSAVALYQHPADASPPAGRSGTVQLREVSSNQLYRWTKQCPTVPIGKGGMPPDRAATLVRGQTCQVECSIDYCTLGTCGRQCLIALVLKDIKLK